MKMTEDTCLFCKIVQTKIPADVVAESDDALVVRDVNPQAPVHVLIVPKTHVRSLDEAKDSALLGRLLVLAAKVARDEGITESGYRTVINTNADGGQSVYHLHVHVLGGRRMKWPPG
jgi:histidine triad (HIT) family protein